MLILILAANTAYNGFPLLASILARDRYLPPPAQHPRRPARVQQRHHLLALAAGILIVVFDASVTHLIQLYILGVFTSFTLSQADGAALEPAAARRTGPGRAAPYPGAAHRQRCRLRLTGLVLIIVTATKFTQGAYLVVIAMPILFVMMKAIRRHYDRVAAALVLDEDSFDLPRVHAIVLISQLHKPAARALAYARATRPSILEAVTVQSDDTPRLQKEWDKQSMPVPLKVLASPLPGGDPADHQLCQNHPPGQPPRGDHHLHPRVRRRALVGTPAAQPERPAPEGPVAVHPPE